MAYRATAGGRTPATAVTLTAGVAYPIAIAFREATGGAILVANVQRTSAPTVAWTNINPGTGSGVGYVHRVPRPRRTTVFASNNGLGFGHGDDRDPGARRDVRCA